MFKEKTGKMYIYFLLAVYVLASSLGMVLIKKGGGVSTINITSSNFTAKISYICLLGLVLYIVSFMIWIIIIQQFSLTYISPVAYRLTFISIAVFSYSLLGQPITKMQLLGAIIIVVGIVIGSS